MPIEISEDVLQNDEFSMVTDSNGDLVLEHKPTGGQFKFDSANNAWTPVQGLAMGGADISGANNVDVGSSLVTQDLTVTGSATGVGGNAELDPSNSYTLKEVDRSTVDESFVTLHNGAAKDIVSGTVNAPLIIDYLYEFSGGTTFTRNGGFGTTTFTKTNPSLAQDQSSEQFSVVALPPAKDVVRIEVGADLGGGKIGAEVLLQD
jgi:hypothetical protein